MKIALIGASGFVGRAVLAEALKLGFSVYAISRHGSYPASDNVTAILKDINDYEDFYKQIADCDVIISCFNAGWSNPNLYKDYLKGAQATINLARKIDKQIIIVGGASVLFVAKDKRLYDTLKPSFKQMVKGVYDLYFKLQKIKNVKWTFISPAVELNGSSAKYDYQIGTTSVLYDQKGKSAISVYDLAHFILTQTIGPNHYFKHYTAANK